MQLRMCAALSLAATLALVSDARAQSAQYRGFWVDTFNTGLSNHEHVVAVVNQARAASANAIFAQVRRRGDSWYLDSREGIAEICASALAASASRGDADRARLRPAARPDRGSARSRHRGPRLRDRQRDLEPPPDPAAAARARAASLQPARVDPAAAAIRTGRDNWLTRSLLPDAHAGRGPHLRGPPDRRRVLDGSRSSGLRGVHGGRVHAPGPPTTTSTACISTVSAIPSWASPARRRRRGRHRLQRDERGALRAAPGLPPGTVPAHGDPAWSQWRRDQVSNLVRRIYLESIAIKPRLKVSGSFIVFGGFSTWPAGRGFWRVYQDWDAWTREGIVDIAMPMNYKREHVPAQVTQYNQWNEWTKDHAYGRSTMIGQGAFLNGVEGTLRQVRRALAPSAAGNSASGVTFFSMATSNTLLGPTAAAAADCGRTRLRCRPRSRRCAPFADSRPASPRDDPRTGRFS